jgi:hypothetical protein
MRKVKLLSNCWAPFHSCRPLREKSGWGLLLTSQGEIEDQGFQIQ